MENRNYPHLITFVNELLTWNRGMNLIGKSTENEVWENHIADSLELKAFLERETCQNVVDIGSGGGLPVIPLSIILPDKNFIATEVDSKKIAFLEFTVKKLNLSITVADLNRSFIFQEECLITSRAFSEIKNILEWTVNHAPMALKYYLLKGKTENAEKELSDAGIRKYHVHPLKKGCIVEILRP